MPPPSRVTALRPKGGDGGGVRIMQRVLRETKTLIEKDAKVTMDQIADRIVTEAQKRAPFATGELEDAIIKRPGGRGGNSIIVEIDEVKAPYAVYAHEGMFHGYLEGSDGKYQLGPGSVARNHGPPHGEPGGVGVKFLERGGVYAAQSLAPGIWRRAVIKTVAKAQALGRSLLSRFR